MKKIVIIVVALVLFALVITSAVYSNKSGDVDITTSSPLLVENTMSGFSPALESPAESLTTMNAKPSDKRALWIGDYWFTEKRSDVHELRYEISVYEENDEYLAHFYVYGFQTMNEFQASLIGNGSSVDFIFIKYIDDNYFKPYKEDDLLISLKKYDDSILTSWGKMQPMLKENESGVEHFKKSTSSENTWPDINNKEVAVLQNTVLVNEMDTAEKGLFYLGMSGEDLLSFLMENDVYYYTMEGEEGEGEIEKDSCLYYFSLFDNAIRIGVDQDVVDFIEMHGSIPLKASSTQEGLYLGDSIDKLVEIYGVNYRVNDNENSYRYVIGDHFLEVSFESGVVTSWVIYNAY